MASGMGVKGTMGRCYPFYADLRACVVSCWFFFANNFLETFRFAPVWLDGCTFCALECSVLTKLLLLSSSFCVCQKSSSSNDYSRLAVPSSNYPDPIEFSTKYHDLYLTGQENHWKSSRNVCTWKWWLFWMFAWMERKGTSFASFERTKTTWSIRWNLSNHWNQYEIAFSALKFVCNTNMLYAEGNASLFSDQSKYHCWNTQKYWNKLVKI